MAQKIYVDDSKLAYYHNGLMNKLETLVTASVPASWTGVSPLTALRTQINQLIALLDNPEQVAAAIDTFNEIVAFLAGIDPSGATLKQFIDLIQAKVQAADSSIQIVYDPQNPTASGTGIKVKISNNGYGGQGLEVVESGTDAQKGLRVKLGTGLAFRQDGSIYVNTPTGVSSVELTGSSPILVEGVTGDSASTPKKNVSLVLAQTTDTGVPTRNRSGLEVAGDSSSLIGGLRVKTGSGLEIYTDGSVQVVEGAGIVADNNGVSVVAGNGVNVSSNGGVSVKPKTNGGISVTASGVEVQVGDGIKVGANGVELDATPITTTTIDAILAGTYSNS